MYSIWFAPVEWKAKNWLEQLFSSEWNHQQVNEDDCILNFDIFDVVDIDNQKTLLKFILYLLFQPTTQSTISNVQSNMYWICW